MSEIRLADENGRIINNPTARDKNRVYRQAKELKERLRDNICTRNECNNPTDRNVRKMIHNEMKNPQTKAYKMAMQAIGADPRDCNIERLRRR